MVKFSLVLGDKWVLTFQDHDPGLGTIELEEHLLNVVLVDLSKDLLDVLPPLGELTDGRSGLVLGLGSFGAGRLVLGIIGGFLGLIGVIGSIGGDIGIVNANELLDLGIGLLSFAGSVVLLIGGRLVLGGSLLLLGRGQVAAPGILYS